MLNELFTLALLVLLALGLASKKLWRIRRRAMPAMLITGGWIALATGILLGDEVFGQLADYFENGAKINLGQAIGSNLKETFESPGSLLSRLRLLTLEPLIVTGLAWVGVVLGLQLRPGVLQRMPARLLQMVLLETVLSTLVTTGVTMVLLMQFFKELPWETNLMISWIIGSCLASWSAEQRSIMSQHLIHSDLPKLMQIMAGFSAVFALCLYGIIFKFFKHGDVESISILGGTTGLLWSVIIAVVCVVITIFLLLNSKSSHGIMMLVMIGFICLAGGLAFATRLSPIFVGFLVGLGLAHIKHPQLLRMQRYLMEAEQPLAMSVFLVAGAMIEFNISKELLLLMSVIFFARVILKVFISPLFVKAAQPQEDQNGRKIQLKYQDERHAITQAALLRHSPMALILGVGFVISTHAQSEALAFSAGEILFAVAGIGLASDALALAWHHRFVVPKDKEADEDTNKQNAEVASE